MPLENTMSGTTALSFAHGDQIFGKLAARQTARLIANASDLTLITDFQGTINDIAFQSDGLHSAVGRDWVGKKFVEVVTSECVDKAEEILGAARDDREVLPREINHLTKSGDNLPVRYSAARLGDSELIAVFGRDISTISELQQKLMNSQLAVEREFTQLRGAESHYRMIFQLSDTPQIVVDAETLKVHDINEAATRLLGQSNQQIGDMKVLNLFESSDTEALHKLLRAAIDDQSNDVTATIRGGEPITISTALFRQSQQNYLLLRLMPQAAELSNSFNPTDRQVLEIVNRMPDAFVVTDSERRVLAANSAFVELMNLSGPNDAVGLPIDTWFDRPRVDCAVLMANIKEHRVVRRFATVLRSNFDQTENVEISAIQIQHLNEPVYGFAIRAESAANAALERENRSATQTDDQITRLVGQMPLRDIVRETTDIIEKLCIETALELTKQNRAMAAQMLGLSRQSFYSKLGKKQA